MSLILNLLFVVVRFLLFRSSCTRSTYVLYLVLSAPALGFEAWLERNGRPRDGRVPDDLEARGATEYMFDVLYWTWGTLAAVMIFGDRAWWLWAAVPIYSAYTLVSTLGSLRKGLGGLGGQQGEGGDEAVSNRQKKLEKRGGTKVKYR